MWDIAKRSLIDDRIDYRWVVEMLSTDGDGISVIGIQFLRDRTWVRNRIGAGSGVGRAGPCSSRLCSSVCRSEEMSEPSDFGWRVGSSSEK